METDLTLAYPFVVMRLRGELHHLEETLREAEESLPALVASVAASRAQMEFAKERIVELHAAIATLED